jgi:hypothetical protein
MKNQLKKYSKLREAFFKKHPMCSAKLPGCSGKSCDIHHSRGRGIYFLDVSTWISVCRPCHDFLHLNPKIALDLNLSELRYGKRTETT